MLRTSRAVSALLWAAGGLCAALPLEAAAGNPVLRADSFLHHVERFQAADAELYLDVVPDTTMIPNAGAWDFLKGNIPWFQCPDAALEEIYYFRWWTFRKHIKHTPDGYVVTEFKPSVGWAGKHNTISCPAGHHFYEGRWLADPQYLRDYAVFWFRKGGEPRRYSFWVADSLEAFHRVHPSPDLLLDLLPDLVRNYEAWMRSHGQPDGLFWQHDDRDGMELGVGGSGKRPTINAYMYGDAKAIARIARLAAEPALAERFNAKAAELRRRVLADLWDPEAEFFKTLACENEAPEAARRVPPKQPAGRLVDVREQIGFVPWYFHLPPPGRGYEVAWRQLTDPEGFHAPFGPTTAEQRHPGFRVAYQGHECQWNGPSWPFATTQTLAALANVLHDYPQDAVTKADYFALLSAYAKSHRFRAIEPSPDAVGPAPPRSNNPAVPRHTWWSPDTLGTTQWIQYDFPEPVRIDRSEVLFFVDTAGCRLPRSWRLLYREGGQWKEVEAKGEYPVEADAFNAVAFAPVTTQAVRLEATAQPEKSAGTLEWRVLSEEVNIAGRGKPSASYSDRYHATLDALNDGARRPVRVETDRPWIDENLNPYNGDWISRTVMKRRGGPQALKEVAVPERGKDYNHSAFCDLVISGLVGLRPRDDDTLVVHPLLPDGVWDWFCLDGVAYRGRRLTILWDRTGEKYGRGAGLQVFADGEPLAARPDLGRLTATLPAP